MPIPITPDHITISTSDADVRLGDIAAVLDRCAGEVVTVITATHPAGITLTVLDHEPDHEPHHLYGAAFVDDGREPDVAPYVIA